MSSNKDYNSAPKTNAVMADKREKKKAGLIRRIFKWIGLGLLSILLTGAVILQAPWKVTTLLVIILAACTMLPKSLRKWFWLSAAGVVIALIVWVFLPDDIEGWRPYTFDKELAAMEAKGIIPAEENAATIYNQLLENYDSNAFDKDFLWGDLRDSILYEFGTRKDYPGVALWLDDNQTLIIQLMRACEKDKCRFPISANLDDQAIKPPNDFAAVTKFWLADKRPSPMRHWSNLLGFSACNDIAEGRINQAIGKLTATLQMAKHLYQQSTIMDMLIGMAIERQGVKQINKLVVTSDANDEYFSLLDRALQSIKHNWYSDLTEILDREKLMVKSLMCAMFYQINSDGRIRLSRDTRSTMRAQIGCLMTLEKSTWTPMDPDSYWEIKLTKATTIFLWFFVPSTPEKTALIIDDIFKKYYAMTEPDFNWNDESQFNLPSMTPNFRFLLEMFGKIMEPNYFGIHDTYFKTVAQNRGSQLIIALRRYKDKNGVWPKSLDDIKSIAPAETFIDPINGDSFIYKLTEDNFELYSKGENNIDEDGQYDSRWDHKNRREIVEKDDLLIWPERSSKDKEENKGEQQQ